MKMPLKYGSGRLQRKTYFSKIPPLYVNYIFHKFFGNTKHS
jgi:hypothetical protein